ncbi:MAG: PorP/SprF family type IX secretion system membrane protein [Bacteroidota bacterium]
MKYPLILVMFLLGGTFLIAQDAHFSQYNASRIYTNPAFAGTDSTLVLSKAYRLQWPNINGAYRTFYISADQYVRFLRGGLGFTYLNDNAGGGALITNAIEINYAPHFEFFDHKMVIQPAIGFGYIQKKLDWSKLTFGDMIDARRGFTSNSNEIPSSSNKSNMDISAGLLIYTTRFYGGIAAHHLTQPDEGFLGPSQLPRKITVHAGANLNFKNFLFSPNILIMKQKMFQMVLPGITAKYKWAVLALSYRNGDAFIINPGFQNRFLKIGYSYDFTTSKLTNEITGGTHELQLTWFLHYQKKINSIKTLRLI